MRRMSYLQRVLAVAAIAVAVLSIALRLLAGWGWLWCYLAAISLATFVTYGIDKGRARRGAWRIPENALHALALAGGAPGALAAQRFFRHKRAKVAFQRVFWLICGAQLGALLLYAWMRLR